MYNQSRIFIDYYNVRRKIERLRANAFISPGSRLSLLIDIEYQGRAIALVKIAKLYYD